MAKKNDAPEGAAKDVIMPDAPAAPVASPPEKKDDEPAAEQVVFVRHFCEQRGLRRWQVSLLANRLGLDTQMPESEIAAKLEAFSKEPI